MDTNTEVVKSVIDGLRDTPLSRGATRAFLFKQAQEFLKTTQDAHLPRKQRRIIARQLATRMKDKLRAEEVSHSCV